MYTTPQKTTSLRRANFTHTCNQGHLTSSFKSPKKLSMKPKVHKKLYLKPSFVLLVLILGFNACGEEILQFNHNSSKDAENATQADLGTNTPYANILFDGGEDANISDIGIVDSSILVSDASVSFTDGRTKRKEVVTKGSLAKTTKLEMGYKVIHSHKPHATTDDPECNVIHFSQWPTPFKTTLQFDLPIMGTVVSTGTSVEISRLDDNHLQINIADINITLTLGSFIRQRLESTPDHLTFSTIGDNGVVQKIRFLSSGQIFATVAGCALATVGPYEIARQDKKIILNKIFPTKTIELRPQSFTPSNQSADLSIVSADLIRSPSGTDDRVIVTVQNKGPVDVSSLHFGLMASPQPYFQLTNTKATAEYFALPSGPGVPAQSSVTTTISAVWNTSYFPDKWNYYIGLQLLDFKGLDSSLDDNFWIYGRLTDISYQNTTH